MRESSSRTARSAIKTAKSAMWARSAQKDLERLAHSVGPPSHSQGNLSAVFQADSEWSYVGFGLILARERDTMQSHVALTKPVWLPNTGPSQPRRSLRVRPGGWLSLPTGTAGEWQKPQSLAPSLPAATRAPEHTGVLNRTQLRSPTQLRGSSAPGAAQGSVAPALPAGHHSDCIKSFTPAVLKMQHFYGAPTVCQVLGLTHLLGPRERHSGLSMGSVGA